MTGILRDVDITPQLSCFLKQQESHPSSELHVALKLTLHLTNNTADTSSPSTIALCMEVLSLLLP